MTDPFEGVIWHNALDLGLRGLGWTDEERTQPYHRLPVALEGQIPERTWELSTWTAGVFVEFIGAPTELFARWRMTPAETPGDGNPKARSGLDTYARDAHGQWRWVGGRSPWLDPDCHGKLHQGKELDGQERTWRVYLPLMREVLELEIGSREPLKVVPDHRRDPRPLVYYGTSIVHGAGVGRSGMPHACQIGRLLDREIINLGFCGMAKLEPAMAEALGRIATPLYIVDPLPNNSPDELRERLPIFLQSLRAVQPTTPILMVQDRLFGDSTFVAWRGDGRRNCNQALDDVVHDLRAGGMTDLHIARHPTWFGDDGEGTTDGSHPNDLGAWRMAQALAPQVEALV